MNSVIAMNGPRSLVQEPAGYVMFGERECPLYPPSVPVGYLCVPLSALVLAVTGCAEDIAEALAKKSYGDLMNAGNHPAHLQVLISEKYGAVNTVTAPLAVAILKNYDEDVGGAFERLAGQVAEGSSFDQSHAAQAVSVFESLTRLHRCAGNPRGKSPGHWRRWRGDILAKEGKGIWKTEAGEWMADHRVAIDYATWLFPFFHAWTVDLIMADSGAKAEMDRWFSEIFGPVGLVDAHEPTRPKIVVDNTDPAKPTPEARP